MTALPNPRSELLREPNLLVPGRKPVGSVKVDTGSSGIILEQWVDEPVLNGVIWSLVSASYEGNWLEVTAEIQKGGAEFTGGLRNIITDWPWAIFTQYTPTAIQTTSGNKPGHVGIYDSRGTNQGSSCAFGGKPFNDRQPHIYGREAYNTILDTASGPNSWVASGIMSQILCSFSPTNHKTFHLWSNGAVTIVTSTTDISNWTPYFDSISIGHTILWPSDTGNTESVPAKIYTAGVMSGSGVTESLALDFIRDPYQFLIPS